jgi:hypothetical protein
MVIQAQAVLERRRSMANGKFKPVGSKLGLDMRSAPEEGDSIVPTDDSIGKGAVSCSPRTEDAVDPTRRELQYRFTVGVRGGPRALWESGENPELPRSGM